MAEPAHPLVFPEGENARAWPAQGKWTYEDYRHLPDDGRRYEVIRGHLYVSPAPSVDHQRAVTRLSWKLSQLVSDHGLGEVFVAPLDAVLPRAIATPVQPDLVFFRTRNLPRAGASNFEGVPDLVIEVLSPSTLRLDTQVKLPACRDAGVPEVWLVDPLRRTIVVHGLSEDAKSYLELVRGGVGESIASPVLGGLRIEVSEIFPAPSE